MRINFDLSPATPGRKPRKSNKAKRAEKKLSARSALYPFAIFIFALLLRVIPDFLEPPHVTVDPDFWYYYMAAKDPSWFHYLYAAGQPLATTYFAALSAWLSSVAHYSLAMVMKLGFAVVDSLTAVALYFTAGRLYSRKAGLLAGLAYAASAQALQGSSLKVRHDGFAVMLIAFAGYVLARMATSQLPSDGAQAFKKRLYFPLTSLRPKHWPYVLALGVLLYADHLLTFYQFVVMVGVLGVYFIIAELLGWIEDRGRVHVYALATLLLLAAFAFFHYDIPYWIGWSVSSSAFIIELAPFSPYYALEWLNLFIPFVLVGLYFAIKERDALTLSLVLVTAPLYYLALRGILYFMLPVALLFALSLKSLRLKKTLAFLVVSVVAINVAIYYQTYPYMIVQDGTDEAQYKAALWINKNSPASALVLANWDRGHLIQAVSQRNVVWVGQYSPSIGAIVSQSMYSFSENSSIYYLKELGSPTYIFLVQGTLVYQPITDYIGYITGIGSPPPGFNMSYIPQTILYRLLYEPSSLKDFSLVYNYSGVYVFKVDYAARTNA